MTNAETREEKVARQTLEFDARVDKEISERFKRAPLIIDAKYMCKEAYIAVMERYQESGHWKVTKSFDPVEKVVLLKFERIWS